MPHERRIMFQRLKRRLVVWVEDRQRREIARLQQDTMRLKEEIERTTGKPVQLTAEDRRLLAEKAQGIDPETLKRISVFDPEELKMPDPESDSAENR